METKKTITGKINLILGGSKDNAAIGKRMDGPNGTPVLHAEFFTACISETDDKGVKHTYNFGIDLITAETLANSHPMNQYKVDLSLHFVKNNKGETVEDIFVPDGKPTVHHKCTLNDYECVKERPMPTKIAYITCLDDAKPAKDTQVPQATVDIAAALNQE